MASHKSALKEMRKDRGRRARNRGHRSELKTGLKKVRAAIASSKGPELDSALREASSLVDRKAGKGMIHRNAAARLKSRLARQAAKAIR